MFLIHLNSSDKAYAYTTQVIKLRKPAKVETLKNTKALTSPHIDNKFYSTTSTNFFDATSTRYNTKGNNNINSPPVITQISQINTDPPAVDQVKHKVYKNQIVEKPIRTYPINLHKQKKEIYLKELFNNDILEDNEKIINTYVVKDEK